MSRPSWFINAKRLLNEREIVGVKHNPLIVRMWKNIRAPFTDDETPWCAAFVGSCLEEAGIRSTRSAAALSYATYGIPVSMSLGAIAYMRRRNSAGKVVGGHVGFVAGVREDGAIMLLGGNQNDRVSIAPFPSSRIIGYRWPMVVPFVFVDPPKFKNDGKPFSTNEA